MFKNHWSVFSALSIISMVIAIIRNDQLCYSTGTICWLICHVVDDLRKKN